MVEKKVIGTLDGADVHEFTISDGGLTVNIMEYGATIHNIFLRAWTALRAMTTLTDMSAAGRIRAQPSGGTPIVSEELGLK